MGRAFLLSPFWPLLPSLSQDTDTEATAMVVDMVMEVMAMEDTEDTMARDPLMLRQDTMAMEDMVLDMDMAVMVLVIEDTDTEVTMAIDLLMLRLMLSQDTTDMEVMVLVMDMEVMVSDMEDTEDTMERDLLMLSQDTTDTEAMDMVDTEVMEVMDMVEDITDKKLVHINQLKAINHKFYFKTDSF